MDKTEPNNSTHPTPDILDPEDITLFYKLNWGLLHFLDERPPLPAGKQPDFKGADQKRVYHLLHKMVNRPELIDDFTAKNPFGFTQDELAIVSNWKRAVMSRFTILDHDPEYSIFLSEENEPKAYGVRGISTPVMDMVPPYLPVICTTILLPFKGKIIHCGLIEHFNIFLGGGIKRTLRQEFQQAKSRFGIITSLDNDPQPRTDTDRQMLIYYMGTKQRMAEYTDNINQLLHRSPTLEPVYHQELARTTSRLLKKQLTLQGLSGWFAVLDTSVIASGPTEKEARARAHTLLPPAKHEWIHTFSVAAMKQQHPK